MSTLQVAFTTRCFFPKKSLMKGYAASADLDCVAPLDDTALQSLHRLVESSLAEEDQRVQEALQATMRFLPRPLRGRAKKLLFPGGER